MKQLRRLVCLLALFLSATTLVAQDHKPVVTSIELNDGDTFMFLGDSITHQCLYTQYVEDYYYTRYPTKRIHFYNSGISGDKASDALSRFEGDIADLKPNYVTVLLGMNDGRYLHFDHDIYGTYEKDMTTLVDKLEATGATLILMGPSMYDSRVSVKSPPRWVAQNKDQVRQVTNYYAGVLAFFGAWVRDQATHRGHGYVDLQHPMEALTRQQRKDNPNFTMIPDAVHPDANGQAVMAFNILSQMNASKRVSNLNASIRRGEWHVAGGPGEVSEIEGDDSSVSFTFKAESLPWVLPPDASLGYKLTNAGHKLSAERLTVSGLKPGKYDLLIDGVKVGTYPHTRLAGKVELQSNDKTPQYQQALMVAMLNKERNEQAVRPHRGLWAKFRSKFLRTGKVGTDEYNAYLPEFKKQVADARAKIAEYDEKIYAINQPTPHRYQIVPAAK